MRIRPDLLGGRESILGNGSDDSECQCADKADNGGLDEKHAGLLADIWPARSKVRQRTINAGGEESD